MEGWPDRLWHGLDGRPFDIHLCLKLQRNAGVTLSGEGRGLRFNNFTQSETDTEGQFTSHTTLTNEKRSTEIGTETGTLISRQIHHFLLQIQQPSQTLGFNFFSTFHSTYFATFKRDWSLHAALPYAPTPSSEIPSRVSRSKQIPSRPSSPPEVPPPRVHVFLRMSLSSTPRTVRPRPTPSARACWTRTQSSTRRTPEPKPPVDPSCHSQCLSSYVYDACMFSQFTPFF